MPGAGTPPAGHDNGGPIAPDLPPKNLNDATTGPRPLRTAGLVTAAALALIAVLVVPWFVIGDGAERPSTPGQRTPAPAAPSRAATLGDGNNVEDVAFSPDGRTLAYTGQDDSAASTVKLWDVAGRRQITLSRPFAAVGLAFSPDGRTLAANTRDSVDLWVIG